MAISVGVFCPIGNFQWAEEKNFYEIHEFNINGIDTRQDKTEHTDTLNRNVCQEIVLTHRPIWIWKAKQKHRICTYYSTLKVSSWQTSSWKCLKWYMVWRTGKIVFIHSQCVHWRFTSIQFGCEQTKVKVSK